MSPSSAEPRIKPLGLSFRPISLDPHTVRFLSTRRKGLEWPIVIVANWQSAPSHAHPGLRIEGGRIALASRDLQSRDWAVLDQEDRLKAAAERERLYYVALTRARDHLVVIDTFAEGTASPWSLYQRMRG